ncbi:MAG: hypothetical protein HY060_18745 [Proteobacteria bacterium]|nr:hypothetical protein [Pseudomonadota bacterium]
MTHTRQRACLLAGAGALAGWLIMVPAGSGFAAGGGHGSSAGGFGGSSSGHISEQGRANTNGPNAADRDFGRDRAADRSDRQADRHDADDAKTKRNAGKSSSAPGLNR